VNDAELAEFVEHLEQQSKQLERTNVVDFTTGKLMTWLELWVEYGVDKEI
jgi:hypothetical protein